MNVSYLIANNDDEIHQWSGLNYYIKRALIQQEINVEDIYYSQAIKTKSRFIDAKGKIYSLFNKDYDFNRSHLIAQNISKIIDKSIGKDSEILFSPSSIPISYLKSKNKKVFYCDATFAGLINFYDEYSKLCKETIKDGLKLEQKAFDNCDLALFSSDWAAQTAIENYNVDYKKIKVVPFGANLDTSLTASQIDSIISSRSRNECNLLFIGVDWIRKGGDIVLKTADYLFNKGIIVNLHIVGPRHKPNLSTRVNVIYHGFISKSTIEGKRRMHLLFEQCHFFIMPTRAEAYGLVFAEANSFALPCIATDVGGVSTIIKNGLNGQLFSKEDPVESYGEYIKSVFSDYNKYLLMAKSSFLEFKFRLNWDEAGKKIKHYLEEL